MEYELLLLNIYRDTVGFSDSFRDSIGQYLIAAYLRKHDFVAQVFSGTVDDCLRVIDEEIGGGRVRIVGFYAAADNIRVVSHAIKWVKSRYNAVTFVGGPQAIALDADFFCSTGNDFAIVGEGEIPVLRLLSFLVDDTCTIDEIPSLMYMDRVSGLVHQNPFGAAIENLDEMPWPHMEDSLDRRLRQGKIVGIITGRGCPNHCAFCYEGANAKNVRFRSIQNVMDEIDYITRYNDRLQLVNVYDDTFTLDPARVLEFCEGMKKRSLKWCCEGHVSFVVRHPDILKTMVDSGLVCIQFGIESASEDVLKAYSKRTSRDMILECVKLCKAAGVHGITGNFIVGGALETLQTVQESMSLAAELIQCAAGIIELNTVYFAPYPNTRMALEPQSFGIAVVPQLQQWNLNTMRSPVVRTEELSTTEIYRLKHRFDDFLVEQYRASAMYARKADVLQGMTLGGKRIHINPTWENVYLSRSHLAVFLHHISDEEQRFEENRYIIRTFEDFTLENDTLLTDAGCFTGLEKEVLLNASGVYTAAETAALLKVPVGEIQNIFQSLNDRCLVYMSKC